MWVMRREVCSPALLAVCLKFLRDLCTSEDHLDAKVLTEFGGCSDCQPEKIQRCPFLTVQLEVKIRRKKKKVGPKQENHRIV